MDKGKSVVAELAASFSDVRVTPRQNPKTKSFLPSPSFSLSPNIDFKIVLQILPRRKVNLRNWSACALAPLVSILKISSLIFQNLLPYFHPT